MNLELTPQLYQAEALLDFDTPIIGIAAGKRSGKSHICIVQKVLLASSIHAGYTFLVASPTYGMSRRNLFPLFHAECTRMGLKVEGLTSKSPSEIKIHWGDKVSTIIFDVTVENYSRMNGLSLAGIFVDEIDKARFTDAEAFLEEALIRLSKPAPGHVAQLVVCGAPELNGYMAEFFIEKAGPDRKLYKWSMMQNGALSDEYKALQLANIPESKQGGWVHGEFMYSADGLVYDSYDPEENHTDMTLADVHAIEDIHVSWDINDGGCNAHMSVRRGQFTFVVDEWPKMASTEAVIEKAKKQPWAKQVVLTCDPACTQVFPYIQKSGLRYKIMKAAPEIEWRVTSLNIGFGTKAEYQPGVMKRKLLVNTKKCKILNRCLMRQGYVKGAPDKKTWIEDAGTDISGPLDGIGYFYYREFPYNPTNPSKRIEMRGF